MSYGKKDEDADQAIVKVDRTSVFQEGTGDPHSLTHADRTSKHAYSTPLQSLLEDAGFYSQR